MVQDIHGPKPAGGDPCWLGGTGGVKWEVGVGRGAIRGFACECQVGVVVVCRWVAGSIVEVVVVFGCCWGGQLVLE